MSHPLPSSRGSRSDASSDFVPLPLSGTDAAGQHRSLRRRPIRIATIAFSFLAATASSAALLLWLIPDPAPPLPLILAAFLCPVAMALTGIWLISSVRSGYRIGLASLAVAIGVTALWFTAGYLDRTSERIGFAVVIVGPAVAMLLLSRHLMTLRRSLMMRPIL